MHVSTTERRVGERVYNTTLLRRSYRQDGKVKKETLANLSHLPRSDRRDRRVCGGRPDVGDGCVCDRALCAGWSCQRRVGDGRRLELGGCWTASGSGA